jgi:hypothetical protein
MIKQVICAIKIRRAPRRHDNIDFKPLVERAVAILPLSVAVAADKGYDSKDNHVLVMERYCGYSIIPPRYQDVPVCMAYLWQVQEADEDETRLSKTTV